MLEITDLCKGYHGREVIHQVSFRVEKGQIHGLIGENGCGKTTLIKCITGIYEPERGVVTLEGEKVYENPDVKRRIGYVADQNNYFPRYRLGAMVKFYQKIYPKFDTEKIKEFNKILELDMNRRVNELSKGQKMRLAFLLNLAANTDVLVMDEPTAGLDAMVKRQMFEILVNEVEARELTVLISSHHLSELEKLCDSVTILKDGAVVVDDQVDTVKKDVRKFQLVFENGVPEGFLQEDAVLHYSNVGNIYTVVFATLDDLQMQLLKERYQPVYTEELPVNLEEVFIYQHGGGMHEA